MQDPPKAFLPLSDLPFQSSPVCPVYSWPRKLPLKSSRTPSEVLSKPGSRVQGGAGSTRAQGLGSCQRTTPGRESLETCRRCRSPLGWKETHHFWCQVSGKDGNFCQGPGDWVSETALANSQGMGSH